MPSTATPSSAATNETTDLTSFLNDTSLNETSLNSSVLGSPNQNMNVAFWLTLAFNMVTLVIYIILSALIVKFRSSEFSSSYYKLFLLSAFVNVSIILDGYISLKLPAVTCKDCLLASLYSRGTFWGFERVSIMGISSLGRGQYLMSLALTLNRFSAVITPLKYDKIWRKLVWPIVIIVVVLPIVSAVDILIYPAYWYYNNATDSFSYKTETDAARRMLMTIGTISISTVLSVFFNIGTVIILFLKEKKIRSRKFTTELKLLAHSLVNFFAELAGTILMLTAYFATDPAIVDHIYTRLLPWASDALTLLSPYILVFCSTSLRLRIKRSIFRQNISTTILFTNQSVHSNN